MNKYVCTFCNVLYANPTHNYRPQGTIMMTTGPQVCGICKGNGYVSEEVWENVFAKCGEEKIKFRGWLKDCPGR